MVPKYSPRARLSSARSRKAGRRQARPVRAWPPPSRTGGGAGGPAAVGQAGHVRADQGLGEGEPGGGKAGGAVGAGAGVQQPDQAEAGHGDADAADRGGEEEGGSTGRAQQGTVAGSGAGHE